jgi:peptidoglycan hydrolase-like protein with peptidoglycan-binding domain
VALPPVDPGPRNPPALPPINSAPALPPAIEIRSLGDTTTAAVGYGTPELKLMDLLTRSDGTRVQQRLASLGYLNGVADGIWGPRSRAALGNFRRTNGLGIDDRWDNATQSVLLSDQALPAGSVPAPLVLNAGVEAAYAAPAGASRNPLNRLDALWAQARLRELGFYSIDGEGVWGPASRDALRDFKALNGLPGDDTWDATTEQALSSLSPLRAQQTFVGGFAASALECASGNAGQPPVIIDSRRAEAFGGVCDFEEIQREGPNSSTWRARAQCSANGTKWRSNVRFTVLKNSILWASEKGSTIYYRCK